MDQSVITAAKTAFPADKPGITLGAVVHNGSVDRVETVFVAGQLKKWRADLVGYDRARIRKLAEKSRRRVLPAAGWPFDVFSD